MDKHEKATFSVTEAGEILGLGRNAAYQAARKGEIPIIRIGGRILVPRVSLERMLEEAGKAGGEAA